VYGTSSSECHRISGLMKTLGSLTAGLSGSSGSRLLKVDHQQPDRLSDLHRGEADAGRVVHRLEHVGDQRLQGVVEHFHRLGNLPEDRIGSLVDSANGHGEDLGALREAFKQWAAAP